MSTNICPVPVTPLINECVCFYCHLTLFARNKLISKGFKSVRWFQNILHSPAHILHITPRCRAVGLDVCGRLYATGTQENLSEQQTFLSPYAVISSSRVCSVWQHVGCAGSASGVQVACRWHWQHLTLSKVLIVNELQRVCVRCKILRI